MYICQTLVQIWRFLYKFWITVLFSANTWQLVRLSFIYLRIRYENPYDIDETLICRLVSSFIKFQKNEGYVFCDGKKVKTDFQTKKRGFQTQIQAENGWKWLKTTKNDQTTNHAKNVGWSICVYVSESVFSKHYFSWYLLDRFLSAISCCIVFWIIRDVCTAW